MNAAAGEKKAIVSYWGKRSEDFAKLRQEELRSNKSERWKREILPRIPEDREHTKILDIGTGAGFFSIMLAQNGYRHVTGIDLTPEMIEQARMLSRNMETSPSFCVMDAEKLNFPSESFDVIITRNLTWTLPHPDLAYREWFRVLKKGGVLLNFDADYGMEEEKEEEIPENHAHNRIDKALLREHDRIKAQLPCTCLKRPGVDVEFLKAAGFSEVLTDFRLSDRIYREKDEFYNPVPMFLIYAVRGRV